MVLLTDIKRFSLLIFLIACLNSGLISAQQAAPEPTNQPENLSPTSVEAPIKLVKKIKTKPKKAVRSDESVPMQLHMVDDFEDGTIETNPDWWTFGNLNPTVVENMPSPEFPLLGERSLQLQGGTTDWYLGGLGTYLGINGALYNGIKLVIWGSGENSGTLSMEFYDDDNGNWAIETYPKTNVLKFDDKFICTLKVDWEGWKEVVIPFKDFWDDNPNIGDGIWNTDQKKGSGGLIQMQMVLLSETKKGDVFLRLDSVSLINAVNIKPYNSENILYFPPAETQKLE